MVGLLNIGLERKWKDAKWSSCFTQAVANTSLITVETSVISHVIQRFTAETQTRYLSDIQYRRVWVYEQTAAFLSDGCRNKPSTMSSEILTYSMEQKPS